jgi:hypothetical protein
METARGFCQQLGGGGQVILGRQKGAVPEIRGQQRQLGLHIGALAVPLQEAMDGKGVAVMPISA